MDARPRTERVPHAKRRPRSFPRARVIVAGAIATLAACGGGGTGVRPNVVLITLDTARADHLGCYGYERNTSPNLDRMAAESVLYLDATSTASWTLPAHASLFTGKFTSSHGARYDAEGPLLLTSGIRGPKSWDKYRARGLSPEETTLAQLLGRSEYATGAVIAGPWMKRVFGLDNNEFLRLALVLFHSLLRF